MNKIILIGNLTKDVELFSSKATYKIYARFSLAVGRIKKDETDFFDCVLFGERAETLARYARKGNKIAITGNVKIERYITENGQYKSSIDIIVNDFEFLTPKSENENRPTESKETQEQLDKKDFENITDTDIPF